MKGKCRKATAAVLSCVLIFLSVAAEFSHHHGLPAAPLAAQALVDAKATPINAGHNFACVACLLGLSHLAVFDTTPVLVFIPAVSACDFSQPIFHSYVSRNNLHLRAPPASLA